MLAAIMTMPESLLGRLKSGIGKCFDGQFPLSSHEKPLADKAALVTNITRGVGDEIAIALAQKGAKIMGVVGINDSREEAKKDAISIEYTCGGEMDFIRANLNTLEGREEVQRRVGEIDIFVLTYLVTGRNNTLIDDFLPQIKKGGTIIIVGHENAAREMKSLRERVQIIPEFIEKGISFFVVSPQIEGEHIGEKVAEFLSEKKEDRL